MKRLPVHSRDNVPTMYALVDDDIYERAKNIRWTQSPTGHVWHASWKDNRQDRYYLHHFVLGDTSMIKHMDGNRFNNQRDNLRPSTMSQIQSMKGLQDNNTSGYKGVSWNTGSRKWQACVRFHGQYYRRLFDDKDEAAKWYDSKLVELHGEQAMTNKKLGLLN